MLNKKKIDLEELESILEEFDETEEKEIYVAS